jgi:IS30 family transposase
VTLTERRSRLHLIRRVSQRTAEAVSRAIIGTLAPIKHVVHTLTADDGKEFAEHELIAIACKADFYFAKPYASWQRGTNENGDGLANPLRGLRRSPQQPCCDSELNPPP